ncbi:hypothetical protein ACI65C_013819 [Semiaphis heraclei]
MREVRNLKTFWETEKAKSRKAFTTERNSRMKTGGGEEEKIVDSSNPDVEALLGKPHIVEWCNDYDGDSVPENQLTNVLMQLNTVDNATSYVDDTFKENTETIDDDTPIVMSTPDPKTQNSNAITNKKVKKLFQGEKIAGIIEESELRVKKQKMSILHENKMNELQILNQKLIMQGLVAKRLEENKFYKLQCQKLALEIKQLKERFMD